MKKHLRAVAGIAATAFFLWLALRGVDFREVGGHMARANWWLLGAAVLVSTLGIHVRALRWRWLLAASAPDVAFRPRLAATAIGFAVNNVLPARAGEFARVWALNRAGGVPLSAGFASVVLERVFDGLLCVGLLALAVASPDFPDARTIGGVDVRTVGFGVGAFAGGLGVFLFLLAMFPHATVRASEALANRVLPERFRRRVVDGLHAFLTTLGVLRSPRLLALSFGWAVFQWLFLAASFWLAFRAFGITEAGWIGALFLQSFVTLAVSIPSSPGFFGPWEAAARYGLGAFGVDEGLAISCAIAFHLGGWLTVTLLGAYYLTRLNLRWADLKSAEQPVERAVETDPAVKAATR